MMLADGSKGRGSRVVHLVLVDGIECRIRRMEVNVRAVGSDGT